MNGTVVIGVGNPYRRDDALGPEVIRRLREGCPAGVRLVESDGETSALLDQWDGAELAIVVDAIRTEPVHPGRIHRYSLRHPALLGGRSGSSHAADLGEAAMLGEILGRLPKVLLLYTAEVADTSFGVGLSAPVAHAADRLAGIIADHLTRPGRKASDVPAASG